MQNEFLDQRKALIQEILREAADRGEIDAAVISDELWDLLPGYLIFRIRHAEPAARPQATVQALVDDVIIPSLTRKRRTDEPYFTSGQAALDGSGRRSSW